MYLQKYLKYKKKYIKLCNKIQHGWTLHSVDLLERVKTISSAIKYEYNSDDTFRRFDLQTLTIDNSLEIINQIYDSHKYLQLRNYNNEKILIIGCGNNRLDNCNLDPISESDKADMAYHVHKGAFTIDAALVANASIVSFFSETITYPTINDHLFDIIYFENGPPQGHNLLEIERLLSKTNTSFCICSNNDGYETIYSTYKNGLYNEIYDENGTIYSTNILWTLKSLFHP